jgi:hypothetical protein
MILNLSKLLDWKLAVVRHLKKADMVNELMCLILLYVVRDRPLQIWR